MYKRQDYIGLGPFRFTTTKQKLSPVIGLEGYCEIMRKMKDASIRIPVVAIGGIEYDDIQGIMDAGVSGVAVSGSIIKSGNIPETTGKMIDLLEKIVEERINNI